MKNIFVGNLNFKTSEDALRKLFESYGPVDRVTILTDRETGRSRGFAFVEMSSTEEGDKAIAALNGTELEGRTLNINEAKPKGERAGGRGR
ncbi:MAG TPA: RNA-binding protein [Terriglobales bacterium]|nr:RNA-binding protein [Terriglobales bacterium]